MSDLTPDAQKIGKEGHPRLIRGMHDLLPEDYHGHQSVIDQALQQANLAGFRRMDTPIMEESRLFDRGLGASSDIVGKEMYSFTTRGGEEVSLRPEGTASVARAFFSHGLAQSTPLRYFYAGPMFRYERPQKGRLRQFHQFGAELIGASGYLADLEILALGQETLRALGVADKTVLHLNTLGSTTDRAAFREALLQYFTSHKAVLSEDSLRRLETNPMRILDSKAEQDRALLADAPVIDDYLDEASKTRFQQLCHGLDALGIDYVRDHNLVRGLDYYEHTAFEFITDALGAQGTVLGGGCYDRLFDIVGGKSATGVGFAAGIERLSALITLPEMPKADCVLIPIGTEAEESVPALAQMLRRGGIATVYGFSGKVKTRMKQANQEGAPFSVIFGAEEVSRQEVKVKDMITGEETTLSVTALVEYLVEKMTMV